MKNTIVVPIDFSASSLCAADYAADFAVATDANLVLVHVCYIPVVSEVPVSAEVINQLFDDAEKNIKELKQHLADRTGNKIMITQQVRQGNVIAQIEECCMALHQATVIMGAHITSATERIIFGSNTLNAMRNLSWPLIIVPNGTRFNGIKIAGLACDLNNAASTIHPESLKKLFDDFRPQLYVLHVASHNKGMLTPEQIEGAQWLGEMLTDFKPTFHYLYSENIEQAIRDFSENNQLNLLIIIPHKHGLFNRLLHKSHSKQMMLNTNIPVMSVRV